MTGQEKQRRTRGAAQSRQTGDKRLAQRARQRRGEHGGGESAPHAALAYEAPPLRCDTH